MPKVSIVVPIYNVEKYLRQCLESIENQTLEDIEVICVNDGSKDQSKDIINEFVNRDPRFILIDKPNTGYGNSMNVGFDRATGEYIGIVESDDYADSNMFESLYHEAHANHLDVLKSGYYFYYSIPKDKNIEEHIASRVLCGKTFCPRTFFKDPMEKVSFFNIKPTIWSSVYRREFIKKNHIRFNETPGASYQDASYNFKVWCCAERVQLIDKAFLHYRQDNESSSVNSPGKVFCVCDEYAEMERFLQEHPLWKDDMEYVKSRIKYDSYMWNYNRIAQEYKYIFIERASADFKKDQDEGYLNPEYFEAYKWKDLQKLIKDPIKYHTEKSLEGVKSVGSEEYEAVVQSASYKIGRGITFIPRTIADTIQCVRDNGVTYTIKYAFSKLNH